MLMSGIALAEVQHPVLGLAEPHLVHVSTLLGLSFSSPFLLQCGQHVGHSDEFCNLISS